MQKLNTNQLKIGKNGEQARGYQQNGVNVGRTGAARQVARTLNRLLLVHLVASLIVGLIGETSARANSVQNNIAVGSAPAAVAVNPVTNRIYVANNTSNSVSVINGADNTTATVAVGTNPTGVAVNQVTNRIYVANSRSDN